MTLEPMCSDLGKSMVTDWLPPFNSVGKTTNGLADRSWWIFSWLIYPLGLSASPWGRTQTCLSLGRGEWLAPSYNWMRTYGQLDPLGVREDNISRASPIATILAWHVNLSTLWPCCNFQLQRCHQPALGDKPC